MTPSHASLIRFIRGYQKATEGVSPSLEEMASGLGIASKSTVHRALVKLEQAGRIIRPYNARRNITIVEQNPLAKFSSSELHAELERRDTDPKWQLAPARCETFHGDVNR